MPGPSRMMQRMVLWILCLVNMINIICMREHTESTLGHLVTEYQTENVFCAEGSINTIYCCPLLVKGCESHLVTESAQ